MGGIEKKPQTEKQRREAVGAELLSNWSLVNKTIEWKSDAACIGKTDMFFSHRGYNQEKIKEAKEICRTCPVSFQCLKYAQENRLPYGIWGGKTSTERLAMLGFRKWPMS